eukprot:gene7003-102_t
MVTNLPCMAKGYDPGGSAQGNARTTDSHGTTAFAVLLQFLGTEYNKWHSKFGGAGSRHSEQGGEQAREQPGSEIAGRQAPPGGDSPGRQPPWRPDSLDNPSPEAISLGRQPWSPKPGTPSLEGL